MSNTIQNGKGSKRRPGKEISQEDWDNIFRKKEGEKRGEGTNKDKKSKN